MCFRPAATAGVVALVGGGPALPDDDVVVGCNADPCNFVRPESSIGVSRSPTFEQAGNHNESDSSAA